MKINNKSIIISAMMSVCLMLGCAHSEKASDKAIELLEDKISDLELKVEELTIRNEYLCGALAESSMMGMLKYVGNNQFLVTTDGKIREVEDFIPSCHNAMRAYTEEIERRKALIRAKEEVEESQKSETKEDLSEDNDSDTSGSETSDTSDSSDSETMSMNTSDSTDTDTSDTN